MGALEFQFYDGAAYGKVKTAELPLFRRESRFGGLYTIPLETLNLL